ncbi:MAG: DUF4388 domain-containing protein [Planctomycetes bacterium]|nr:DUF4388 domain-containing protein [Planctomycetota bacterium]
MDNTSSFIVLVDPDRKLLQQLQMSLKEQGYDVLAVTEAEAGLSAIRQRMPDMVITEVVLPNLDGWSFITQFRSLPGAAFIPVVFLSNQNTVKDRIHSFRLGADDYLGKPFDTEELIIRVARALDRRRGIEHTARAQRAARKSPSGVGLHGTLGEMGLASLLTILEMERKSGILEVRHPPRGETAAVLFKNGRIVQACVDGKVSLKNHEAVYYLSEWSGGKFEFTSLPVDVDDEINASTSSLLLEAARRLDENRRRETHY